MIPLSIGVIGVVTHKNVYQNNSSLVSDKDKNLNDLLCSGTTDRHVCRSYSTCTLENYFKRIFERDLSKSKSIPEYEDI